MTERPVFSHGALPRRKGNFYSAVDLQPILARIPLMIPGLKKNETSSRDLVALSRLMTALPAEDPEPYSQGPGTNPTIPAGYTYLAQFIDHDIGFFIARELDNETGKTNRFAKRSIFFDLDCVYGEGPGASKPLYVAGDGPDVCVKLLQGAEIKGSHVRDLPRKAATEGNSHQDAIIADPRNDDHMIISQIHASFIAFHNRAVDIWRQRDRALSASALFDKARETTRRHYQWIVLWDFLARISGGTSQIFEALGMTNIGGIPAPALRYYGSDRPAYVPGEFSLAAFRFGHSMVRPSYFLSDTVDGRSYSGRFPIIDKQGGDDLRGRRPIPRNWGLSWQFFFPYKLQPRRQLRQFGTGDFLGVPIWRTDANGHLVWTTMDGPQQSMAIDHEITATLARLPDAPPQGMPENSLMLRDIVHCSYANLASGQTLATELGVPKVSPEDLAPSPDEMRRKGVTVSPKVWSDTPLFYYLLKEAETKQAGTCLGPLGRKIVIETFVGLLWNDPTSVLHASPAWRPECEFGAVPGEPYTMSHFLNFALDLKQKPAGPWPPGAPRIA